MKAALIFLCAAAVAAPALAATQSELGELKVTYEAKTGKYCVSRTITGYLMPVKECRTQEEWADRGLNISRSPRDKLASK